MTWKFASPPDTGVVTTRQVYVEGELLSLVSHDLEGDWQFLHDEEADEEGDLRKTEDLIIVHFDHIVDRFPEVEQLADLPIRVDRVARDGGARLDARASARLLGDRVEALSREQGKTNRLR